MLRREGRKTVTHPEFVFMGMDQQSIQLNAVNPDEIAQERGLQAAMTAFNQSTTNQQSE